MCIRDSPRGEDRNRYRDLFGRLWEASREEAFAAPLLADTCALQLMIALNRDMLTAPTEMAAVSYRFDPKMEEVTHFIRDHLGEELTIERLSGAFFLSRCYLMQMCIRDRSRCTRCGHSPPR